MKYQEKQYQTGTFIKICERGSPEPPDRGGSPKPRRSPGPGWETSHKQESQTLRRAFEQRDRFQRCPCLFKHSLIKRKETPEHTCNRKISSLFQQGQGPSILEVAQFCIPQFACIGILRSPEVLPPEWLVPWPFRKMFCGELLPLHVCSGVSLLVMSECLNRSGQVWNLSCC